MKPENDPIWEALDNIRPKEGALLRVFQILLVIGILGFVLCAILFIMAQIFIWLVTVAIDLILLIPFAILWIFNGKFYGFKLSLMTSDKFKLGVGK